MEVDGLTFNGSSWAPLLGKAAKIRTGSHSRAAQRGLAWRNDGMQEGGKHRLAVQIQRGLFRRWADWPYKNGAGADKKGKSGINQAS